MRVKREKLLKFQLADKVNGYWFTFSNKNLSEINLSVYSNAQFWWLITFEFIFVWSDAESVTRSTFSHILYSSVHFTVRYMIQLFVNWTVFFVLKIKFDLSFMLTVYCSLFLCISNNTAHKCISITVKRKSRRSLFRQISFMQNKWYNTFNMILCQKYMVLCCVLLVVAEATV